MSILNAIDISKRYVHGGIVTNALYPTSVTVEKGEFVTIIGPSGSGKSTMLNLLGGLDRPDSGQVIIKGTDITGFNNNQLAMFRRETIGFVFQAFNLIPILNVEENISLPILLANKKVDEQYLSELLVMLGIEDKGKRLPTELSGGQQQRVAIARALITKPAIILADEPTGNLDSKSAEDVISLLITSSEKYEQTIILITHNEKIAARSQRSIVIEDGQILEDKVVMQR